MTAPVTAIIAYDLEFYEQFPKLAPKRDGHKIFAGKTELIAETTLRNGSLQGAYFVVAARALGLDCGPMSGFDRGRVDAAFFGGTTWRSEEHTSELQSLMRISYAVFCLKKKKKTNQQSKNTLN